MPKAVHDALARAARSKGLKGDRAKHFIYGTMTNMAKRGEIKSEGQPHKPGTMENTGHYPSHMVVHDHGEYGVNGPHYGHHTRGGRGE